MKKIEAKTLEAAYASATKAFGCSITELDCEIVQYPSAGILGVFAKQAIIVVAPKQNTNAVVDSAASVPSVPEQGPIESVPTAKAEKPKEATVSKGQSVETAPARNLSTEERKPKPSKDKSEAAQETVLESFFEEPDSAASVKIAQENKPEPRTNNMALQEEIEAELMSLISMSCFDIDVVEVDVIENTAYIFIDGEDAALLIGKEGYRYNALSYLISNWLHNKHNLYIKLEIAQFLASQQEMIRSYMEPVIEHVEKEGWGRTRTLDGVLVQIALEQLREEFPNKYVAIKRTRNGDRYVLINEFNKR